MRQILSNKVQTSLFYCCAFNLNFLKLYARLSDYIGKKVMLQKLSVKLMFEKTIMKCMTLN